MTTVPACPPNAALQRLRRAWRIAAGASAVGLWIGYRTVAAVGGDLWPHAGRWVTIAAAASALLLRQVWRWLPENRPNRAEPLLATLGPGTGLTLARGVAVAAVAGFLFLPPPAGALAWVPALLYTAAALGDALDGPLARRTRHVTRLGVRLDLEVDALAVLVGSLLAILYGRLPLWYLAIGLARYVFVFGLWWRTRRGRPVHQLPASRHRRVVAGFQMGFLAGALWPIAAPGATELAGVVFAVPTLAGFVRDWLVTSARLDVESAAYRQRRRRLVVMTTRRLPVLLRPVVVIAMIGVAMTLPSGLPPSAWTSALAAWGYPSLDFGAAALALGAVAAIAGVATGLSSRGSAGILILALNLDVHARGLDWANGPALAAATGVLLLGPGRWPGGRP